jgi:hypothetical protein
MMSVEARSASRMLFSLAWAKYPRFFRSRLIRVCSEAETLPVPEVELTPLERMSSAEAFFT